LKITSKETGMAGDLKTISAWAKELGVSDKKLKDAIKELGIEPDSKKGACSYFGKASVEKATKAIK
jgi:hypothetical protein